MSETQICPKCRTWFEVSGRGPKCPVCGWRVPGYNRITSWTVLFLIVGLGIGIGGLYLSGVEDDALYGQVGVLFLAAGMFALAKVFVAIFVPRPARPPEFGDDRAASHAGEGDLPSAWSGGFAGGDFGGVGFGGGDFGGGDGGGGGGGD